MEDEKNLAARAAQGDQEAFTIIVERYRRYIYAIAWKITLHEEDALDAAQEVFERMARRISDWDGRGPLRAWLGTITARVALGIRKRGRREQPMEPLDLTALTDTRGGFDNECGGIREELEKAQQRERVAGAMITLTPQQRAIFGLRFLSDLRPREIAERLGLPRAQVSSQLSRALVRLREVLKDEKNE